jgi:SagB-type dehydrogenase family enzyme
LPAGLYHYNPLRHRLERIRRGFKPRRAVQYCSGQSWVGRAAALFVMSAAIPRVAWKYRMSRAYRAVLLEAGHLCQTFCLVATWRRLAPFCTMALADSMLEKDLGLDGLREPVIYLAGVGVPRSGAGMSPSRRARFWASW